MSSRLSLFLPLDAFCGHHLYIRDRSWRVAWGALESHSHLPSSQMKAFPRVMEEFLEGPLTGMHPQKVGGPFQ